MAAITFGCSSSAIAFIIRLRSSGVIFGMALLDEQDRTGKLSKSFMELIDWLFRLQTQAHLAAR